jgi:hypothetical protein
MNSIAWIFTICLAALLLFCAWAESYWIVHTHQSDDPVRNDRIKVGKISLVFCLYVPIVLIFLACRVVFDFSYEGALFTIVIKTTLFLVLNVIFLYMINRVYGMIQSTLNREW